MKTKDNVIQFPTLYPGPLEDPDHDLAKALEEEIEEEIELVGVPRFATLKEVLEHLKETKHGNN